MLFFPALRAVRGQLATRAGTLPRSTRLSEQTPWRPILWPFKMVVPLTCLLLLIQGISETIKASNPARTGIELEHKEKVEAMTREAAARARHADRADRARSSSASRSASRCCSSRLPSATSGWATMVFDLAYFQTIGMMKEELLAAVPLFIFMGYITEQAGLMERLFRAFRMLLAPVRGSLYLVVILTATVFAMATGIVGAAVTVLGIMAARS